MRDDQPPRRSRTTGSRLEPPVHIPSPRQRRRKRRKGRPFRLLLVLLVVVLLPAAAGVYVHRLLNTSLKPTSTSAEPVAGPPFGGKKQVYLLVLGVDEKDRLSKSDARRADTMILASIDFERKRVAALSLPRDTRVQIPGRPGHGKLNAAHTFGGPQLVRQTIEGLTGLTIDRYAKTDVGGFRSVVDLVGPIELDVEKKMDYDDNWGNLHIHLKPGRQSLDGEKAMHYVRFRHDATGDIGRMKRQQKFLRAVAKKMLALSSLPRLPQVVQQGMKFVETDMTPRELMMTAALFKDMPMSQVATATLPGTPQMIHGVSYVVPDEKKARLVMHQLFEGGGSAAAATANQPARPRLEVLNGNGLVGIAGYAKRKLSSAGFVVSKTGKAENFDYEQTEVRAGKAQEPEARRAAATLGLANVTLVPAAPPAGKPGVGASAPPPIVVILGKDYRP